MPLNPRSGTRFWRKSAETEPAETGRSEYKMTGPPNRKQLRALHLQTPGARRRGRRLRPRVLPGGCSRGLELDPAAPAGCAGCSPVQPRASDSSLSISPSARKARDRCLCPPTAVCWGPGRSPVPGATSLQVDRTAPPCTSRITPGALRTYFRSFSRRDFGRELMLECAEALGAWRWVSAFRVWVQRCSLGRGHGGSRNAETTRHLPGCGGPCACVSHLCGDVL